jgi:hypothetical protein
LGDQLESVHAPRVIFSFLYSIIIMLTFKARAYDTLQLMRHFDEFLADQPLSSPIFTDPDRVSLKYSLSHLNKKLNV